MTSISILLASTLEMDFANVAECFGDFYQGLSGCFVLCRQIKALGLATIALLGVD